MGNEQILRVIGQYWVILGAHSDRKKDEDDDCSLCHVKYMIPKVAEFVNDGRLDKAFRWLGFMQGVLWGTKVYTLDELKQHNAPVGDAG